MTRMHLHADSASYFARSYEPKRDPRDPDYDPMPWKDISMTLVHARGNIETEPQ